MASILQDYLIVILLICGSILFLGGLFVIACLGLKLSFFVNHPKYKKISSQVGDEKARRYFAGLAIVCFSFAVVGGVLSWILSSFTITSTRDAIIVYFSGMLSMGLLGYMGKWISKKNITTE